MCRLTFTILLLAPVAAGCGEYKSQTPVATNTSAQSSKSEESSAAAPAQPDTPAVNPAATPTGSTAVAPLVGQPSQTETVREQVQVGAGDKGRNYGGGALAAPVTVPVATYFGAKERIAFEINVPRAVRDFNALNGRNPTEEEFFPLLKEYGVDLPSLPMGHRYVFDQQKGELQVEKPAS